jgi:DNA-binding transcriptional LysR family regulator
METQDITRSRSAVHLPGLLAFDSVARHMNFARAATEHGVTPTAMSKTVKALEAQLGIRLFNRTTRSVALTEAGAKLLASVAPALAQIGQSIEQVGESSARPRGGLRINTSYVAYAALIEPHVDAFLKRYPDITLEVVIDNALNDIVSGGFDAGIRLGHAVQRDMIALPIGPLQRLVVVGAPKYLTRRGTPKAPKDLLSHDCVRQRIGDRGRFLDWEFVSGSKPVTIEVQGRLVVNEMRCALTAARQGNGLAYVFKQFAAAELAGGKLVTVLDRHCPPGESFHLYYPNRAQTPGKLRAFIEFVRAVNWEVPA